MTMVADISFISYFAPVAAFVVVFAIVYAVLAVTKLFAENAVANAFVSLLFGIVFIAMSGAREFIMVMTPWFVVAMVCLVFVLTFMKFSGIGVKDALPDTGKWIGVGAIVVLVVIFVIAFYFVFSDRMSGYLPGPEYGMTDGRFLFITDWLYSPQVVGAIVFVLFAGFAIWFLVKGAGAKKG